MAKDSATDRSRFPAFYKLSVRDRLRIIHERGWLTEEDYLALVSGKHTLRVHNADKMIENVVGVMGLPVGLGLNFLVNDRDYIVPLVVEEPSIVAALSSAAKLVRASGGFAAEATDPVLIGQVQVVDVPHVAKARAALRERREEILNLANSLHPQMVARGGGARDIEVHVHPRPEGAGDMLVLHLLVDTRDAMGANLVNTMCEGVAALTETITGGRVFLRILSNLTDRAMVRARCVIPVERLASGKCPDGADVRDGIVLASEFAAIDPYRAATHNKGVMNGIDAVALATGNDWRAIEAAAHAWAARTGRYTALTRWYKGSADGGTAEGEQDALVGEIEIPLKVGTVGGPLQSNPTVALNLRLLGVDSAVELAELMGAVGLAQNFSALRALSTDGIQQGHMTLHARSVAMAAGATADIFDTVVERLVEDGDIKIWKAQEVITRVRKEARGVAEADTRERGCGHGKVILLGEHAVVYGSHALAAPVPLAVRASVQESDSGYVDLMIPRWGMEYRLHPDTAHRNAFQRALLSVLDELELRDRSMIIEVFPSVPRAMGLGGSAAMAVAIIRALDLRFGLGLSDEQVNRLAFACEGFVHGTPSGIDNTVATFGSMLLYRRGVIGGAPPSECEPEVRQLQPPQPVPLVIGISGKESLTAQTVAAVRRAWQQNPALYEEIFRAIDRLTLESVRAVEQYDLPALGEMMNVCHGQLNALRVSSWEIEELVQVARENGALGAKLTGGGGGGSVIALCPDDPARVVRAMRDAGYQAMEVQIGG